MSARRDRRRLDLLTIGRSSVDLYGEQVGGRLEDMGTFVKYLGGCPANIAAGASRLGLRTALLTRVGDDHMGRFIIEQLRREGVCTDAIVSDPGRLTALVILGIRDEETFPLLFYRENCADMALCEDDVDAEFVRSARAVLITGTHLSQPGVRAASLEAVRIAKGNGGRVILDGDYRPVLWGLTTPELGEQRFVADDEVTSELQTVLPDCDLIVGTEEELHILGGTTDTYAAVCRIRELTDAQIVCKRGERGCIVYAGGVPASEDDGVVHGGFPIEVFNVLGAGDAFMSGFLRGWLRDEALEECCRLGNAAGALVVSRHGCTPASPSWAEMQYFLEHGSPLRALRKDRMLEHVHWATNRDTLWRNLTIVALDELTEIASLAGGSTKSAADFLDLVFAAIGGLEHGGAGLILDGESGRSLLEASAGHDVWVGRVLDPVAGLSVADQIREWPLQQVVVARLDLGGSGADVRYFARLFNACRRARHELLLEVVSPATEADGLVDTIASFAAHNIYPDWWAIPAELGKAGRDRVVASIAGHDAACHGVLLTGRSRDAEFLHEVKASAGRSDLVRGAILGPRVFGDVPGQWFAGEIGDRAAIVSLRDAIAACLHDRARPDRQEAS
ncbi:MAG: 5-dehydro-2-deoxygluconokinase [Proteobacteria bacterium]|nr:5-dehydro-2-deoxygluconokinase [Pseudomonadota bacterium]